jgi:hypothetical protein
MAPAVLSNDEQMAAMEAILFHLGRLHCQSSLLSLRTWRRFARLPITWRDGRIMVGPELPIAGRELFRSDAKAEDGRAFVEGWDLSKGPNTKVASWWYLEVLEADFPWAFAKANDPNRVIATLELLGTVISIMLFDYSEETLKKSRCTITGETDNQGISLAMRKFMSTKWPLSGLLGELSEQLRHRNIELHLDWLPRLKNCEADAITNQDSTCFSLKHQIRFEPKDLRWIVLERAMSWAKQIYDDSENRKLKRKAGKFVNTEVWKRKKTSVAERMRANDPC